MQFNSIYFKQIPFSQYENYVLMYMNVYKLYVMLGIQQTIKINNYYRNVFRRHKTARNDQLHKLRFEILMKM